MKNFIYLIILFPVILNAQRDFLKEGNNLLSQNKNKEAEKVFREGLKHDKKNVVYQTQIGLCLLNQGKYDEAQQLLDKVIAQEPNNAAALWYLGVISFQNATNFRKAIGYFEKVYPLISKTSPQYASVNFFIGKAYRNLLITEGLTYDETNRMLQTSKEYVKLDPKSKELNQFLDFIKYVEENRPPANVKKWVLYKEQKTEDVLNKDAEKK